MVQASFHSAPTSLISCPTPQLRTGWQLSIVPRCLWRSIFFKLPKHGLEHNCFSFILASAPLFPCVALRRGLYRGVLYNCSLNHFPLRAPLSTLTVLIAPGSPPHTSPHSGACSPLQIQPALLISDRDPALFFFHAKSYVTSSRFLFSSHLGPALLPVGASTWFVIMSSSFLFCAPFWAHPRSHGSWGQEGLRLLSAGAFALAVPNVIHCGLLKPRWSIPVLFATSCPPACHL